MKVYIVLGTSGEYSDREIWTLGGFYSEDNAKKLVENATKEAMRIYALIGEKEKNKPKYDGNTLYGDKDYRKDREWQWQAWISDFDTDERMKSKYDEDINTDRWQEASYYYEEVELMDG